MSRSSTRSSGATRAPRCGCSKAIWATSSATCGCEPRMNDLATALQTRSTGMSATARYPRDLIGHGAHPPHARWPGDARIAVQFVLNYEEGGENSVLHGDAGSEQFLSEMYNPPAFAARHLSMESIYEYGSRAACGASCANSSAAACRSRCSASRMALERHPEVTRAPSSSSATRSPATAGAGSTTRTSTRRPSASTCSAACRSSSG